MKLVVVVEIWLLMLLTEDDNEEADTEATDESGRYNYRIMLQRDKRRWARADSDGDGELSKEEFSSFLHPEETESMRDIIIDVRSNFSISHTIAIFHSVCPCRLQGHKNRPVLFPSQSL